MSAVSCAISGARAATCCASTTKRCRAPNCSASTTLAARSEERRVGKECRSLCDWSSDVCSSDLRRQLRYQWSAGGDLLRIDDEAVSRAELQRQYDAGGQIGRASCRERV